MAAASRVRVWREPRVLPLSFPSGGATLLRGGTPLFTTVGGVVERIPSDDPRELSEIISAQPTILIDRDIAMAWTPYEFYIDGVLAHVGSDIWGFTANNSTEGAAKKFPI
ncbi:hypothetical protein B0H13DRAFT_2412070 [Mycena leptocephala]|nr:hypothetical protein B0H13DRAFT_2412070 [Mycena leptocephala]